MVGFLHHGNHTMKRTEKKMRLIADLPLPLAIAGGLMIFLAALPAVPEENEIDVEHKEQVEVESSEQVSLSTPVGLRGTTRAS